MLFIRENIRLEEAMNIAKEFTHKTSSWEVHGLHVRHDAIPKECKVDKTIVNREYNGEYLVGVCVIDSNSIYIMPLEEFSTIKEVREAYPNLFEIYGTMCTF